MYPVWYANNPACAIMMPLSIQNLQEKHISYTICWEVYSRSHFHTFRQWRRLCRLAARPSDPSFLAIARYLDMLFSIPQ